MNQQTRVKEIKLRSRADKLLQTSAELTSLERRPSGFGALFVQLDRLVRNFAVVAALVLVTVAVRNSDIPEAQTVFGVMQESAGMQWDESIGKLSFVNSFFPEEIQAVWSSGKAAPVALPMEGTVVHAWSVSEPYLLIECDALSVCASADGEVMGIAHGVGEEMILRLRHDDGTESIYGNLQSCWVEAGDWVQAGQSVGQKLADKPLAFEIRLDGRSVQPEFEE